MPDLSGAGQYLGGWAPHGASQALLGRVAAPVLGECKPPPAASEPGFQPICTAEALFPGISSQETMHLASGSTCVSHVAWAVFGVLSSEAHA